MGREYTPVTGATNLRKGLPARVGIVRIPPAGPHAPDKATRAHACTQERVAQRGTEPERPLQDLQAPLGTDPRQGIGHVNERPHLHLTPAVLRRPCRQRFIGFQGAPVEGHEIHRR